MEYKERYHVEQRHGNLWLSIDDFEEYDDAENELDYQYHLHRQGEPVSLRLVRKSTVVLATRSSA